MGQEKTDETTKRLNAFFDHKGLNNRELSELTGISQSYFSHLRTGRKPMSTKISKVLKKSFPELNIDWLMHGQGEMVYQNETRNIHTEPIDIALLIIELSQIEATLDLIRKSVQRIRNQITIKLKE